MAIEIKAIISPLEIACGRDVTYFPVKSPRLEIGGEEEEEAEEGEEKKELPFDLSSSSSHGRSPFL